MKRVISRVGAHELPPRPSLVADVPAEVDDVFLVGMAKDPSDRFDSATSFARALRSSVGGQRSETLAVTATRLSLKLAWAALP